MAAPTILGTACSTNASFISSHSITLPSWSDGDLGIIFFAHGAPASTPSAPTNWTEASKDNGGGVGGAIFYKKLATGDTDPPSVTTSANTTSTAIAVIIDAGTYDDTDIVDVVTTTAAWNTAVSTTPQASAVTTNNAESLAFAFGALDGQRTPYTVSTSGWTETHTPDCVTGNQGAIIGDKEIASASSTGAVDFSQSPSDGWVCAIIAINAVAASGFTLDAAGGTYTLTGTAATLQHDKTIAAASDTYTWTGTAATLQHDKILSADAGAYAWTGSVADLIYTPAGGGDVLNAESGTYTLTGTAATLQHDKVVGAAAGSYTWTGAAAGLARDRTLSAEAGAYVWTGTAAAFPRTYAVSAEAGAYTFTGSAANLVYSAAPVSEADNSDPPITGGGRVMAEGQLPQWWGEWEEPQPQIGPPEPERPLAELLAEAAGDLGGMPTARDGPDLRVVPTTPTVGAESGSFVVSGGDVALVHAAKTDRQRIDTAIREQRRQTALLLLTRLLD